MNKNAISSAAADARPRRARGVAAAVLGLGLAAALVPAGAAVAAPGQGNGWGQGQGQGQGLGACVCAAGASGCPLGASQAGASFSVYGTGTVTVEPDVARLSFSVLTDGDSASEAAEAASEQAASVTAALAEAGVEDESVQTSGVSVYPVTTWDDATSTSKVAGYTASVDFEVSGVAVSDVAEVLGAAIAAGANQTGSVAYYASDYDVLYEQALALAVEQASSKAQALVAASGEGGAAVLESISEQPSSQQYRYADAGVLSTATAEDSAAGSSKADVSASVVPGTIDIEAEVQATYRLSSAEGGAL